MRDSEEQDTFDLVRVLVLTALMATVAVLFYEATVRHVHDQMFSGIGHAYSEIHGHLPPTVNDPPEEEQQ